MISFLLIAALILGAAITAVSLRNLVHCALSLAVALAGIGVLYLNLGAQFVGFAQILVYIGAVAILIVFAILLTRGAEARNDLRLAPGWGWSIGVTVLVAAVICGVVLSSRLLERKQIPVPEAPVRLLGAELMTRFILPLEVIGLLLTAALIGAVIIAMRNKEDA